MPVRSVPEVTLPLALSDVPVPAACGEVVLMTLSQNRNSLLFQMIGVSGMSSQSILTSVQGVQLSFWNSRK